MRKQVDLLDDVFAAGLVKDYSLAVDGGANVGDWTEKLLEQFDIVHAFEPSVECIAHLQERFYGAADLAIWQLALLDRQCDVNVISTNKKPFSQKRYVEPASSGEVHALPLDAMNFPSCGLIKLDLEGAEGLALLGARETIAKFRPVLIVEFFRDYSRRYGHSEEDVLNIVKGFGYREALASYPDKVFVHAD